MTDPTARLASALADRYRIERILGTGGMATVYLAHDVRHDRPVAVKVLRPDLAAVIGVERFLAEIKTTAQLQHAHILGLIDSGEVNGTVFYVMPFVEGESLRARLQREKQIPITDAVRIASDVAGALDYAHRRGVIHRDIKPENILLHEGQPLVADFGIALAVTRSDTSSRITESGMSLGTPHYMSPEQAMGERTLDARTDVYSLGCVLYEMLTGEPPFNGPTAQAIIAKVMTVEPEPVTTLRRSVPMNVAAATMTALNKVAADRFASAAEFAAALANPQYVTPELAARRAASRIPILSRRELTGVAVMAVLAIVAVVGWMRHGMATDSRVAWLEIPVDAANIGGQVHLSHDGSRLLWSGANAYWERRLDSLGTRRIRDAVPQTVIRDVSPDGREIVVSAPGRLSIVPLGGGPARDLPLGGGGRGGAAWGSDGYIYATFGSPQDRVRGIARVRPNGGAVDTVAILRDSGFVGEIIPAAGGLIVGRSYPNGIDSIATYDVGTKTWKTLAAGGPRIQLLPSGYLLFASGQYIMAAPFDGKRLQFTQTPIQFVELNTGIATLAASDDILLYRPETDPQGEAGIEVRTINGGATLLEHTAPSVRFSTFAVSPDGKRFVASGTPVSSTGGPNNAQQVSNLYVYTLPSGPMQRLRADERDASPAWIPGTRDLAFARYVTARDTQISMLLRRSWDGSTDPDTVFVRKRVFIPDTAPPRPVAGIDTTQPIGASSWFPNGTRAVVQFGGVQGGGGGRGGRGGGPPGGGRGPRGGGPGGGGGREGQGDLMLFTPGTRDNLRPLFATEYAETSPALSPDGKLLAYVSNSSTRQEVYVSPVDGSARLQVSLNGGAAPKWSRNGQDLFFRNATSDTLFSAHIERGADLSATNIKPVLMGASLGGGYAVLPGDTAFVMRPPAAETHRPFIVVLNVTKELATLFAKK